MKLSNSVLAGLLGAAAVVMGVIENFIPMPVPAVRLGLSNIPVMMALYLSSARTAFAVLLLKCFLVPVFSGNMLFKLSLGLPAGLASFAAMTAAFGLARRFAGPVSVGVTGAFVHMYVQLAAADYLYIHGLLGTRITGVLLLISVVTGIFTGLLTEKVVRVEAFRKSFDAAA